MASKPNPEAQNATNLINPQSKGKSLISTEVEARSGFQANAYAQNATILINL